MKTRTLLSALAATVLISATPVQAENLKSVVNPPELPNSLQYGYSQATVVAPASRLIHVAGQVGLAADGPNGFKHQVDRAFENLIAALEAAGGRLENVVKITLLIKDHDPAKLQYLVKKRRAVFGSTPPASTLIPVTALYADDVLFEIDAVAVAPLKED